MIAWGCAAVACMGQAVRESPMGPVGPWYSRNQLNDAIDIKALTVDDSASATRQHGKADPWHAYV